MAMDHNPSGRRPHYQRGRRGMDRRGSDRRAPQQAPEQAARASADQVDVEQIMREIRARISQRHGIELSTQQIQDLAARRLEAILDPRTVSPTLMDQLRKGAAAAPEPPAAVEGSAALLTDEAIFDSGSGILRFFRRLLRPLLKLFFNPAPLVTALQAQAGVSRELAARAAEADRRQAEWNALHYQILQRLVTEVARGSIEMQALSTRVESLAARVDFNDRRVRSFEAATAGRTQRTPEVASAPAVVSEPVAPVPEGGTPAVSTAPSSDGPRRRRRRRRGRRGSLQTGEPTATSAIAAADQAGDLVEDNSDVEEGDEDVSESNAAALVEFVEPAAEHVVASSPPPAAEPAPPVEAAAELPPQVEATPIPSAEPAPFSFMPQPAAAPPDEPAAPPEPTDPGPPER